MKPSNVMFSTKLLTPALLLISLSIVVFFGMWFLEHSFKAESIDSSIEGYQKGSGAPKFISNTGQWPEQVSFMTKYGRLDAWFTREGFTLQSKSNNVKMTFINAHESVLVIGENLQSARLNYFIGNDSSKWRSNVPCFENIRYENLYDGIDLCVRFTDRNIEYDLLLAPGANLSQVRIACNGISNFELAEDGSLIIETLAGAIIQKSPKTWYKLSDGEKEVVNCSYKLLDENTFGFEIQDPNPQLALVIDPELAYSTYIGGSDADGNLGALGIWNEENGLIYVAGSSDSPEFPTTSGAYNPVKNDTNDVVIFCLDPTQTGDDQLIWSTFLGGSDFEIAHKLVFDDSGNPIITGRVNSNDFPTTSGVYSETYNGGVYDCFISKLSANGSQLLFSTYLGGDDSDWGSGLAVNSSGDIIVSGYTGSSGFPTTSGAYDQNYNGGGLDAFVTRFNSQCTSVEYSTFLGGSFYEGWETGGPPVFVRMDLVLKNDDQAVLCGKTFSSDFPIKNAYQTENTGAPFEPDAFISILELQGNGNNDLIYSTYLGTSENDCPYGIHVDEYGIITVGGWTFSSNFPTTANAFDNIFNSGPDTADAFITQINPSVDPQDQLIYSTFLGGNGNESVKDISIHSSGIIDIVGNTYSFDFPITADAFDKSLTYIHPDTLGEAFFTRLYPKTVSTELYYSTFIGGSNYFEVAWGVITSDIGDEVFILGYTNSEDFPVTENAYDQKFNNGFSDIFISNITGLPLPPSSRNELPVQNPNSFLLNQNYPNPFNPSTTIEYSIPKSTSVEISVYNLSGQKIKTLANKSHTPGTYQVTWDGSDYASGVYIYQIKADHFVQSKKMLLLK